MSARRFLNSIERVHRKVEEAKYKFGKDKVLALDMGNHDHNLQLQKLMVTANDIGLRFRTLSDTGEIK